MSSTWRQAGFKTALFSNSRLVFSKIIPSSLIFIILGTVKSPHFPVLETKFLRSKLFRPVTRVDVLYHLEGLKVTTPSDKTSRTAEHTGLRPNYPYN